MKWYLAKLIYRIICSDGNHKPQFDEQLRLIYAADDLHAFQKARLMGEKEEDHFLNSAQKPVQWKFIDVSELHQPGQLIDGAEMYSNICEQDNAEMYIRITHMRANYLLNHAVQHFTHLNRLPIANSNAI